MKTYKSTIRKELPEDFAFGFSSTDDHDENPLLLGHKLMILKQQRKLYTIYAGLISILILPPIISILVGVIGWQNVFPSLFTLMSFLNNSEPVPDEIQLVATIYVISVYFTALICIGVFFYFSRNIISLQTEITKAEGKILSSDKGRIDYLDGNLRLLSSRAAVVLLNNQTQFDLAQEKRFEAERILEISREFYVENLFVRKDVGGKTVYSQKDDGRSLNAPPDIGKASSLIYSIQELVNQAENKLDEQRKWQLLAIVVMTAYLLFPLLIILSFPTVIVEDTVVPVFGIPLSVIMWAAAGSLAAILYKIYMTVHIEEFAMELRWLIARPIIGIIMGALAYLAVTLGLLLITADANNGATGTATSNAINNPPGRIEAYWIIAFLAGFSDKFYNRIIELLASKTFGYTETVDEDKISTTEFKVSKATQETVEVKKDEKVNT